MPPFLGEPLDRRAQSIRADALALTMSGQADVEPDRAVLRLGLLREAQPAGQLTVGLDRPRRTVHEQVLAQPPRLVGLAPPLGDPRLTDDVGEWLEVGVGDGAQRDAAALKHRDWHSDRLGAARFR